MSARFSFTTGRTVQGHLRFFIMDGATEIGVVYSHGAAETAVAALNRYAAEERREGYWYLATPYSKYPRGLEEAFQEACRQSAVLIKAGIRAYSPIAHTHPIAVAGGMDPLDHGIWLPADRPFMDGAQGLIVCKMDGWSASYGIGEEVKVFVAAGKPVIYMEPGQVPVLA